VAYSLTKHGVFDAVWEHGGEASCEDVARDLALNEEFLCRMMDAGRSLHLFGKKHRNKFHNTATGMLLQTTHAQSLSPFVLIANEEIREGWRTAAVEGVKSGHGEDFVSWMQRSDSTEQRMTEHARAQFDMAMKGFSAGISASLIGDWAPPANNSVICDVGGGLGHMLVDLLTHYPEARGVLFELPSVAARAEMNLAQAGHKMDARVQVVSGDYIEPWPLVLSACDVFYFKFIWHSMGDQQVVDVLSKVKAAAKPGALLVSTDFVRGVGGPNIELFQTLMDINMLAATKAGRERTFAEYAHLLHAAGMFGKPRLIRMRSSVSSIEVEINSHHLRAEP
jgi:hypothetical protein